MRRVYARRSVRPFKEQLLHIVGNMTWLSHEFFRVPTPFDADLKRQDYTEEETLEILRSGLDYAAAAIQDRNENELDTKVLFFTGHNQLQGGK